MKKSLLSALALMCLSVQGAGAQALREDGFSITFKGGIAPTIMTGTETRVVANAGPISALAKTPTFSNTQDLPFVGAAEVEYAFFHNLGIFAEGVFTYSTGKKSDLLRATVGGINVANVSLEPESYKDIAAYAGARFYYDVGSGFSPFIQGKAGFVHQLSSDATFKVNNVSVGKAKYYGSGTDFSAGAGLGAVLNFDHAFSLVLSGEAVYKGQRETLTGKENMWSFPVTAALRITL